MMDSKESRIQITRMSKSSWFKIKTNDLIMHLDPGYGGFYENQGIPEEELIDKASVVLITHPHKDHIRMEVLEKVMDQNTQIFCPEGCIEEPNVKYHRIVVGDEVQFDSFRFQAIDAYNTPWGHSIKKYHEKGKWVGYLIQINNKKIYFAGDTDFIEEMDKCMDVDVAFLPIGGTYVMDLEEAYEATMHIKPKIIIPMHQAENDMQLLKQRVEEASETKVKVLHVGDKILLE